MTSQEFEQDVRKRAATAGAELRRRGWTQGSFAESLEGAVCRVCAGGAVMAAQGLDPRLAADMDFDAVSYELMYRIAESARPFASRGDLEEVYYWNDESGRKVEDVLAVFDQIASAE